MSGDLMYGARSSEDALLLDKYRKIFRTDPNCSYVEFAEVVHLTGGDNLTPAVRWCPKSPGDNMGILGFRRWREFATYSVLDDEFKLPTFSGVYAVTTVYHGKMTDNGALTQGFLHLLYIGSARSIADRMKDKNHWYNRALRREPPDCHTELWVIPTTDYRRIERDLIRSLRPLFNIQHRNG